MNNTKKYLLMMEMTVDSPIVRTNRTISESKWTVHHQRTKNNIDTHKVDVVVVGNDLVKISKNPIFISRVYQSVFNKGNWEKEMKKDSLKIIKIELGKQHGESFANNNDKILN